MTDFTFQLGERILRLLLDEILDHVDLIVIQCMTQLSYALRVAVLGYLRRRINVALRPWITRPTEFRRALRETESLISGSVVLSIALRDPWFPNDLNIYSPLGESKDLLVAFLVHAEHYVINQVFAPNEKQYSLAPRNAHTITILHKLNYESPLHPTIIKVVESPTLKATTPILQSTTTWAMNWLSSDGIGIAYPRMTFKHIGLRRTARHTVPDPQTIKDWNKKYTDRAFRVLTRTKWSWDGSPCCGPGRRETNDPGCLSLTFGDKNVVRSEGLNDNWILTEGGHMWRMNRVCPQFGFNFFKAVEVKESGRPLEVYLDRHGGHYVA